MDSEKTFKISNGCLFIDEETYQPQSNKAKCGHLNAAVRLKSSSIPPVSTVRYCGQTIVLSIRQHSTTWWSDHRAFHQSAQCRTVVRSSCIPSVGTVPYGGQIIVHSVRRHSAIQWSDHRVFHQLAQCHTVVRSSCIRPVMTVVRSLCIPPVSTVSHNGQIIVLSTSQHSTTWWSDQKLAGL